MKKIISTLFSFFFFTALALSQAHYTFIEFKDGKRPALQNEYSYSDKTVTKAIDEKFGKMGYKGKDVKGGYVMYKGVSLPDDLGNQPYDLYFSVENKSRKDKENVVVTMLISTGNENFVSDSADSKLIGNAKNFLDNLLATIVAYDLQQQIIAQDEIVKKAEKKYRSLANDADDMQKKKKKLEQDIEDNQKAQKDQQAEIDRQKQLLETLKGRQK